MEIFKEVKKRIEKHKKDYGLEDELDLILSLDRDQIEWVIGMIEMKLLRIKNAKTRASIYDSLIDLMGYSYLLYKLLFKYKFIDVFNYKKEKENGK